MGRTLQFLAIITSLWLGAFLRAEELPYLTLLGVPANLYVGLVEMEPLALSEDQKCQEAVAMNTRLIARRKIKVTNGKVRVTVVDMGGAKFKEYIKGVVLAEMAFVRNVPASADEVLKAQALAAIGKARRAALDRVTNRRTTLDGKPLELIIGGAGGGLDQFPQLVDTELDQVYLDPKILTETTFRFGYPKIGSCTLPGRTSPLAYNAQTRDREWKEKLDAIVNDALAAQALIFDGRVIGTEYFATTNFTKAENLTYKGFTRSSEETQVGSGNGSYQLDRRMSPSPDGSSGGDGTAHGCGMSQEGAKALAVLNGKPHIAKEILEHYYGPTAPILRSASIHQNGEEKYRVSWRDVPAGRNSGEGTLASFRREVVSRDRAILLDQPVAGVDIFVL